MSQDTDRESAPIEDIEQLVEIMRGGEKPHEKWRVGTEHEKLAYWTSTGKPVAFENGIEPIMQSFCAQGWTPFLHGTQVVGAFKDGASLTLEPGGQFELSGAPLETIHQTQQELREHITKVREAAQPLGIGMAHLGFRPMERVSNMPWMPRERHQAMRRFLATRGRRAHEMMLLSATTQENYDYESEEDMARKMRVAMKGAPIAAALFANSPYRFGQFLGNRTTRYSCWLEVDPDRCGMLPFVLNEDFGYRDYVEYALDVPMFFIRRGERYIDPKGTTMRTFIEQGYAGERAHVADFENQLSGLFPEVRLKSFIEVRSADVGDEGSILALAALWKGILYDLGALAGVDKLLAGLSLTQLRALQYAAAQDGLLAHGPDWSMLELATDLVRMAREGLIALGKGEEIYLQPLFERLASEQTRADDLLQQFGAKLDEQAALTLLKQESFW